MYENYNRIRISRDGHVLTVAMDNPPMNAVSPELHTELDRLFRELPFDDDTRVVVLTGIGRAFSAGGDLGELKENRFNHARHNKLFAEASRIVHSMIELDKPVIARVNGHAMGLGATLALLCDILVMSERAKIADPHVNVGLVAGDGGALLWPLAVGMPRAKEALLLGDPITATEAKAMGLINHVAEDESALDAKVTEIAKRLANGPQAAIRYTKRALNMHLRTAATTMVDAHLKMEMESIYDADHHEAVDAFLEERKPQFGRGPRD